MLVEQKQMFAPAEISRSWMFVADDAAVYQSGAKFPPPARPCRVLRYGVCSCLRCGRREHIHEPQDPGTHSVLKR